MQSPENNRPRIGISACLLGHAVRFDGGHKRDRFVTDSLSRVMDFVPVCPELEAGMGVPRPAVQLRQVGQAIRLVQAKGSEMDYTDRMAGVAASRGRELAGRISGFILQSKSPSCGIERVPVANERGEPMGRNGTGMFVQHFTRICPLIPVEEAGRLNDPVLRENFLGRVYALDRWYRLDPGDIAGFIAYHTRHKLLLMTHGSDAYSRLGRIVAGVCRHNLAERRERYIAGFLQTMAKRASRNHHYNVLQHIMGYLKHQLQPADKRELLAIFQSYRAYQVPLSTPVALLTHHLRKNPLPYLARQHYLNPYPETLALRALV